MSVGNGTEAIHSTGKDGQWFLGLVAQPPERFGTEVHAFAPMDNHYHLLLRCRRADLSATMR